MGKFKEFLMDGDYYTHQSIWQDCKMEQRETRALNIIYSLKKQFGVNWEDKLTINDVLMDDSEDGREFAKELGGLLIAASVEK